VREEVFGGRQVELVRVYKKVPSGGGKRDEGVWFAKREGDQRSSTMRMNASPVMNPREPFGAAFSEYSVTASGWM